MTCAWTAGHTTSWPTRSGRSGRSSTPAPSSAAAVPPTTSPGWPTATASPAAGSSEVLDIVGLSDVAGRRVGTFSLGMNQRLGIAAALLGDPETVMFDEPINGLDPEGILWIRNLMKSLASEGRTVFLSSHLMSEMAQTADHLIVIGRGRIIADAGTDEFINRHTAPSVRVRAVEQADLAEALTRRGALIECGSDGAMVVTGMDSAAIGGAASAHDITLVELAPLGSSLEEAYFDLTKDETDYQRRPAGRLDQRSLT